MISYNILADYLAWDHRPKLYFHIPYHVLDWEWRKRRLLIEFGLWNADIMCLQEVDRFHDIEEELAVRGYTGIWKMRTGNAVDGCAIFWRTNRFQLRHEEHIEFSKLRLRDNVAQICVLESRIQSPVENASAPLSASSDQPRGANQIIICNIHVLYNPKRGEIKLGQVRALLDRAYAVSRIWNDAPVIICGDFNSIPRSPLYNFIAEQKLSLSGLARDQVSGQYSASIYAPRPYYGSGLYRTQPAVENPSKVAIGTEHGSSCSGSPNHYKPQNDIGNASLTEKLPPPQRSTGMLDIPVQSSSESQYITENDTVYDAIAKENGETDVLDGRCSESISTQCRFVDQSEGTVESCNEQSGIPFNIGNDGKEQTPTISCSNDPCFEGIQQEHGRKGGVDEIIHSIQITLNEQCSQSIPTMINESTDRLDPGLSSGKHELSQTFTDYSSEVKNTANFSMEVSDVSAKHENLIVSEIWKQNINANWNPNFEGSAENLSCNMASEEVVVAETAFDNKVTDVVTEISSLKMFARTSTANVEVSTIESTGNPPADLATKQEGGIVVSFKNISENSLSDLSTRSTPSLDTKLLDLSLNEVGKIVTEDANCDVDLGTINSSADMLACIGGNVSSHDINCCNNSTEPNSEEGCQSLENFASECGLQSSQLEDPINVGQGDSVISDLCSSEENSDPNFFKELLGTEDACDYREEVNIETLNSSCLHKSDSDPSSVDVLEDSSGLVGPHAAVQEKHSYNPYNPYLWTPMEIEVASGNAECTFVEHNLKLRSAYTDVQDYAGTKDSSKEPQVTSYNRQFMGTVDYIWYSEGLQTVKVLDTIPKHVLQRTPGFPTQKWGSDHIALACQLAFTRGFSTK